MFTTSLSTLSTRNSPPKTRGMYHYCINTQKMVRSKISPNPTTPESPYSDYPYQTHNSVTPLNQCFSYGGSEPQESKAGFQEGHELCSNQLYPTSNHTQAMPEKCDIHVLVQTRVSSSMDGKASHGTQFGNAF